MRITGLDFETANWEKGSICSAGLALLEDGCITEKREWLIKPHKSIDYVIPQFTEIHGIDYYDLRQSPEFSEIWLIMRDMLQKSDYVTIHNCAFDLRHLKAAMELYHLPHLIFRYMCTLALSRKKLPGLSSYSLDSVAAKIGFTFQHHDALEDAIACATIANHLGVDKNLIKQFDFCGIKD